MYVVRGVWGFPGFFDNFDIQHARKTWQIKCQGCWGGQENVRYFGLCTTLLVFVPIHTCTFPLLTKTMLIFHYVKINTCIQKHV